MKSLTAGGAAPARAGGEEEEKQEGGEIGVLALSLASGGEKDMTDDKRGLQHKRLHMTYTGHFDLDVYHSWIQAKVKEGGRDISIVQHSYAQEKGENKVVPYDHTHVAVEFSKALNARNMRFFDYTIQKQVEGEAEPEDVVLHPHIRVVTHPAHWKRILKEYHAKEGGLRKTSYVPEEEGAGEQELSLEEMDALKGPRDLLEKMDEKGISLVKAGPYAKAMELSRQRPSGEDDEVLPAEALYEFQKELVEYVEAGAWGDKRTIVWVQDYIGGGGKTETQKYIERHHKGITLTTSNVKDAVCSVVRFQKEHGYFPEVITFNLVKAAKTEQFGFYHLAEQFRDGRFSSDKYDSKAIRMVPAPLVIILANYSPDLGDDGAKYMTPDRWSILSLDGFGRQFSHRFLGPYAKVYHQRAIEFEQAKVVMAREEGKVYSPISYEGSIVLPVRNFPAMVKNDVFKRMADLFNQRKIGSIALEGVPVSNATTQLSDIREMSGKRLPTAEEVENNFAFVLRFNTRDMTREEAERMDEIDEKGKGSSPASIADYERRKEDRLSRFRQLLRGEVPVQKNDDGDDGGGQ
jgi:hypothetical protein